jgi:ketosteroid isomerase-like protein
MANCRYQALAQLCTVYSLFSASMSAMGMFRQTSFRMTPMELRWEKVFTPESGTLFVITVYGTTAEAVRESRLSRRQEGRMRDQQIRAALDQHWAASDANDFETEHRIYHDDAVLEYPQSGERIRGRLNIQVTRSIQPNKKRFTVQRIIGGGDLWITEFILSYDGKPSYTVSIMEFRGDKVARETQYFADPFEPSPARAQYVERMDRQSRSAGIR